MKKNENILYVGGFELPDKNAAAQRVVNNSKLFSKINYQVFFNGISKNIEEDESDFNEIFVDDFKFYTKAARYPKSLVNWFNYIIDISNVKKIIENDLSDNVSLVIAYNYPSIKLWRLQNYCKKRKIRVIADVTEWYQPEGPLFLKAIKSIDTWLRMKFVHFNVDGIIAISNYLMNYYKSLPCLRLPPLVDKNSQKWENKFLLNKNEKKLLSYVGSPGSGKKDRLDLIIISLSQIIDIFPQFIFQIIGITETEYMNSFPNLPVPQNLKDHIVFHGRKNHLEAIEFLKESDFTIFVRDINLVNIAGFPTKFVESISLGIPVITNITSDLNEYLFNGNTGFILDFTSLKTLNSTLLAALSIDHGQLIKMKKECSQLSQFHYENYIESTRMFISNINNNAIKLKN